MKKIIALLSTLVIIISTSGNILSNVKDLLYTNNLQTKSLKQNVATGEVYYIDDTGNSYYQKNSVPYPITSMYTFKFDSGNRKKGDIYFGTTDGLYLRKFGELETTKINGIDKTIAFIQCYSERNATVHVVTTNGNLYYIDNLGNSYYQKNSVPYPITSMYTFKLNVINRKTGDIYFGTTNGLYLRKVGELETTKINGIEGIIKMIIDHNMPLILTNNNDIFSINDDGIAYSLLKKCWTNAITTIYTFNFNIYFGTTDGIFYFNNFDINPKKIEGINDPIAFIQDYNVFHKGFSGTFHVVTTNGNLYYVNEFQRAYKQNNVPYPITSMYTFKFDSGNRKKGDIYFGTTKGLYLRKAGEWETTKINGIDKPIAFIQNFDATSGAAHLITLTSFPYYLNSKNGNGYTNLSLKNENDNPELNISDDAGEYNRSLILMTQGYLRNRGIITENNIIVRGHLFNMGGQGGYFIVNCNINLPHADQNRRLQLVFDSWNLYMQGFIVRYGNSFNSPGTYFCFTDSGHINDVQAPGLNTRQTLGYDSNYNTLATRTMTVNWNSVSNSFASLLNFQWQNVKQDVVRVVLVTAEAIRFGNIVRMVSESFNGLNWENTFGDTLRNWNRLSHGNDENTSINVNGFHYYISNANNTNIDINSSLIPFLLTMMKRK